MITDEDIAALYHCLLDRAPEGPGTVSAFRTYYPTFERGRRAVLRSSEFAAIYGREGNSAGALAQGFLRRAGGIAVEAAGEADPALPLMLKAHGDVRLAVVIGEAPPGFFAHLGAGACAVHIHPDHPGFVPITCTLPEGGVLFRIAMEPRAAAALLAASRVPPDVVVLPEQDEAEWFAALGPLLAERAIVLGGRAVTADTELGFERILRVGRHTVRFRGGWFLPVTYVPEPPSALDPSAPRLAIATIVRNEEAAIANMLRSAAPLASYFVVLDTGSTDSTMEQAEAFLMESGALYVLRREAADRFDAMRNAALDLVPPEYDWVLMLDADEELCAEDYGRLQALMRDGLCDAYALPRYNYLGGDKSGEVAPYPDRQVRLIRNRPDRKARYEGAVHEKLRGVEIGLAPLNAASIGQGAGGPHIHHLVRRFRTPEAEERKQQFYRDLATRHAPGA